MGTAEGGWDESVRNLANRKGGESTSSSFVKISMLESNGNLYCISIVILESRGVREIEMKIEKSKAI